jgi:hypothetical protein
VADLPAKESLDRNDELLAIFSFFLLVIISTFNIKKKLLLVVLCHQSIYFLKEVLSKLFILEQIY